MLDKITKGGKKIAYSTLLHIGQKIEIIHLHAFLLCWQIYHLSLVLNPLSGMLTEALRLKSTSELIKSTFKKNPSQIRSMLAISDSWLYLNSNRQQSIIWSALEQDQWSHQVLFLPIDGVGFNTFQNLVVTQENVAFLYFGVGEKSLPWYFKKIYCIW